MDLHPDKDSSPNIKQKQIHFFVFRLGTLNGENRAAASFYAYKFATTRAAEHVLSIIHNLLYTVHNERIRCCNIWTVAAIFPVYKVNLNKLYASGRPNHPVFYAFMIRY